MGHASTTMVYVAPMSVLRSIRLLAVAATVFATLVVGGAGASARVVPDGGPNVVDTTSGSGFAFEIAFNSDRDEYFAVWRRLPERDIAGQRLDANGEPLGPVIVVAEFGANGSGRTLVNWPPDITYNATTKEYLVVYSRGDTQESTPDPQKRFSTVFGRLVSNQGALVGTEARLNPPMGDNIGCIATVPNVTHDPSTGGYVLVHTRWNGCTDIGGGNSHTVIRALDGSLGQVATAIFPLISQGGTTFPAVAYNPVTEQIMVTQPYLQTGNPNLRRFPAQIYTSALVPVGGLNVIDVGPDMNSAIQQANPVADPVTGNWFVATEANNCCIWTNLLSPSGESLRAGTRIAEGDMHDVDAVGDGSFVVSTASGNAVHVRADGTAIHTQSTGLIVSNDNNAIAIGADGSGVGIGYGIPGNVRSILSYGFDVVAPGVLPLVPSRLLDTRIGSDFTTVDGVSQGIGQVQGGRFVVLQVAGRGGVPDDARAVNLNVTADQASGDGFVSVYPCDADARPNTSNLNLVPGVAVAAAAFARLSEAGTVCVFTSTTTHVVIDVNGFVPDRGSVEPLVPARLLETRPGFTTVDGISEGGGRVSAGSTTTLKVTDRGGVDSNADAVIVNTTSVFPFTGGFVTVFPCDEDRPNASNVNGAPGRAVNNLVLAKVSAAGTICLFSSAETHLLVDVAGFVPESGGLLSIVPARLLETRSGFTTVDGREQTSSPKAAGSTTTLSVAGRGGVAADATGAVLNVVAAGPDTGGFLTVFPCDEDRPNASNVNFGPGAEVSNAVVVKLSATGTVCLFSLARTDLIVDVVGYSIDS
jgi:hypothetical protein